MKDSLVDRAIHMMMHTDRTHRHLIDERVRDIGLHRTAHMLLMHLSRVKNSPSQRELAERFSITPAAVTGHLKNLERDGYITRTTGRDTRFKEITLTEKGHNTVIRSRELFHEVDQAMFQDFTEGELQVYIRALEKIQLSLSAREEKK